MTKINYHLRLGEGKTNRNEKKWKKKTLQLDFLKCIFANTKIDKNIILHSETKQFQLPSN